jgi:hypothetical protein
MMFVCVALFEELKRYAQAGDDGGIMTLCQRNNIQYAPLPVRISSDDDDTADRAHTKWVRSIQRAIEIKAIAICPGWYHPNVGYAGHVPKNIVAGMYLILHPRVGIMRTVYCGNCIDLWNEFLSCKENGDHSGVIALLLKNGIKHSLQMFPGTRAPSGVKKKWFHMAEKEVVKRCVKIIPSWKGNQDGDDEKKDDDGKKGAEKIDVNNDEILCKSALYLNFLMTYDRLSLFSGIC